MFPKQIHVWWISIMSSQQFPSSSQRSHCNLLQMDLTHSPFDLKKEQQLNNPLLTAPHQRNKTVWIRVKNVAATNSQVWKWLVLFRHEILSYCQVAEFENLWVDDSWKLPPAVIMWTKECWVAGLQYCIMSQNKSSSLVFCETEFSSDCIWWAGCFAKQNSSYPSTLCPTFASRCWRFIFHKNLQTVYPAYCLYTNWKHKQVCTQ